MFFSKAQFNKLKELEKVVTNDLSDLTKEVLLGLDLVTTNEIYNTSESKSLSVAEGTLALMDVNHCCSYVDSMILKEMSDYYKILGNLVEAAEIGVGLRYISEYTPIEFKFDIDKNNQNYQEFVSMFHPISVKDPIGGVHDEGLGWAPDGTYCGECSKVTCEGCTAIEDNK